VEPRLEPEGSPDQLVACHVPLTQDEVRATIVRAGAA
jgi:hypothetical protein